MSLRTGACRRCLLPLAALDPVVAGAVRARPLRRARTAPARPGPARRGRCSCDRARPIAAVGGRPRRAGVGGGQGLCVPGVRGAQPQLPPHWQEPPLWQPQLHPEPQPQAPSSGTGISVTRGSRMVGVGDGVVGKSAMSTLPRLCWTYLTADPRRTRGGPADHWTPAAAGAATARESTRAARGERAPRAVRSRRPRPPPHAPVVPRIRGFAGGLRPFLIRRDG